MSRAQIHQHVSNPLIPEASVRSGACQLSLDCCRGCDEARWLIAPRAHIPPMSPASPEPRSAAWHPVRRWRQGGRRNLCSARWASPPLHLMPPYSQARLAHANHGAYHRQHSHSPLPMHHPALRGPANHRVPLVPVSFPRHHRCPRPWMTRCPALCQRASSPSSRAPPQARWHTRWPFRSASPHPPASPSAPRPPQWAHTSPARSARTRRLAPTALAVPKWGP